MTERLQAGFLDRVFNSTIGLPQQLIWRIWRAIEDDEIDLFSEKGLLDAALLPGVGMFDDHKEDVMPDYMAEQLKLADKGESGFGSQISAAILSDPLTYMTGGLSALGKLGKAASTSARVPVLKQVLRESAKANKTNLNDLFKRMSPEDLVGHIDTAAQRVSGKLDRQAMRQHKRLLKMKQQITGNVVDAQARHQRAVLRSGATGPAAPLSVADALTYTRDRQISLGLPILHRWGAKWDIPKDHQSWWQLFKEGSNRGGTALARATMLNKMSGIPGIGSHLKGVVAPLQNLRVGWKVGGESRWGMQRGQDLDPEVLEQYGRWLSPDGAAPIARSVAKAVEKQGGDVNKVIARMQAVYEKSITTRNMSHEDALKASFRDIKAGYKSESGTALYGRLTGRNADNEFFPNFGPGASKGKAAIPGLVNKLMAEHAKASKLHQQGLTTIAPVETALGKLDKAFELSRAELKPVYEMVAGAAYETGKAFKKVTNTIFRTGQSSALGEREYAKFLTNVARDNAHVEALAKSLYTKLRKLSDNPNFPLSQKDVTKLVGKMTELDALPGEIAASFRAAELNPENSARIMRSMDNFFKRQRATLVTFEKMLKQGGITDGPMRQKLVDAMDQEIFPFIEKMGAKQSYLARFNRRIANQSEVVDVFTPQQQSLMLRANNAHRLVGVELPLTPGQVAASKLVGPDAFTALGQAQRGAPEAAMLRAQKLAAGDLFKPLEDIGDLTHRLTEDLATGGYNAVKEKLKRSLRYLKNPVAFKAQAMNFDVATNARVVGVDANDYLKQLQAAMGQYADAHAALPVYNEAQELARDAAVALGRQHFDTALKKLERLQREIDKGADSWTKFTRKNLSETGAKSVQPKVMLSRFDGRQLGTLTNDELDSALTEIERAGMRDMTPAEIAKAAEEMPAIQDMLQQQRNLGNDLTVPELLAVLGRSGKGNRIVSKDVTTRVPLWKKTDNNWTLKQAQQLSERWGYDIVATPVFPAGKKGLSKRAQNLKTFRAVSRHADGPVVEEASSLGGLMDLLRRKLNTSPQYSKKYGPGLPRASELKTAKKNIKVASDDIERARKLLTAEERKVLAGKSKRFDDATLPEGAAQHNKRLTELRRRRGLKSDDPLFEQVITPTKRKLTKAVAPPRASDEFKVFLERAGLQLDEGQLSDFALNYARGRILLGEVASAAKRYQRAGKPLEVDQTILKDLEAHVAASGAAIRGVMEAHLPGEFVEIMDTARQISGASFEAAKASGVWAPGSPIAYLPRFFNKAGRARIARIVDDVDQTDGAILARLGVSQSQYYKRHMDEMTVDDLNDFYSELGVAMNETGASPALRVFHKQLDKEMEAAGIGIGGVAKKLPFVKGERVETDPFLSLVQRWGVAQQDSNLEQYFDSMLAASTGKNGESLMMGGRIIGIVDDTGNVQQVSRLTTKLKSVKRGKNVEDKALKEVVETTDYTPKSFVIELDDGTRQTIDNSMLNETGFGMLALGHAPQTLAEGVKMTTGKLFTRASLRSDLHNSLFKAPLGTREAADMLGKHVVFGHGHNITGLVKSAAQVHKVTPPALRMFDALNYGIKSFQTIFRLPFHIANLSSGVFQAHLAGASPKNLMASYLDTMRFMFGNQEFSKHVSMATDMMDVGGNTVSRGISNLLKGDRTAIQQATQQHGDGALAAFLSKQDPVKAAQLDQFEDLTIKLQDGTEIDMAEFVQVAGEMQLYGTFASSLTRGSRGVADNLMRIKMNAMEPSYGGLFKTGRKLMEKGANVAETSEVLNRTATALALVREGHPMKRAIEIAKEAHVPYEKLTPFEKNVMKRFSVYYTFPRHYMPWAWTRFMEDPAKLSSLTHFIRDQKLVTTQEGKPNLVAGQYRFDLSRLNANLEAAGLVAAFADRILMPMAEAMPGIDAMDERRMRAMYSDAGITAIGGLASVMLPGTDNFFGDPSRGVPGKGAFEEAADLVWPLKYLNMMLGKRPFPSEESPFVDYTPMESLITSNVFGPGVRKVREKHEVVRANLAYRRMIKQLQLRAAATEDRSHRQRLIDRAQDLSNGLRQLVNESSQKVFQ
ncbi:MAG: hypothetical protein CL581_03545 [Alteromonadaceae bacterium]|nr:hypothetical protein [Alteromonadaceae bacterium]